MKFSFCEFDLLRYGIIGVGREKKNLYWSHRLYDRTGKDGFGSLVLFRMNDLNISDGTT